MTKPPQSLIWENNQIVKTSIQAAALLKDGKAYQHCYCINKIAEDDFLLHVIYFGISPKIRMPDSHYKTLEKAKEIANKHYLEFLRHLD